jgi:hypothetical protein
MSFVAYIQYAALALVTLLHIFEDNKRASIEGDYVTETRVFLEIEYYFSFAALKQNIYVLIGTIVFLFLLQNKRYVEEMRDKLKVFTQRQKSVLFLTADIS